MAFCELLLDFHPYIITYAFYRSYVNRMGLQQSQFAVKIVSLHEFNEIVCFLTFKFYPVCSRSNRQFMPLSCFVKQTATDPYVNFQQGFSSSIQN